MALRPHRVSGLRFGRKGVLGNNMDEGEGVSIRHLHRSRWVVRAFRAVGGELNARVVFFRDSTVFSPLRGHARVFVCFRRVNRVLGVTVARTLLWFLGWAVS